MVVVIALGLGLLLAGGSAAGQRPSSACSASQDTPFETPDATGTPVHSSSLLRFQNKKSAGGCGFSPHPARAGGRCAWALTGLGAGFDLEQPGGPGGGRRPAGPRAKGEEVTQGELAL